MLFVLPGGIMVLVMHAGFAFLELGTVRKKNQVNALVKILTDFSGGNPCHCVGRHPECARFNPQFAATFALGGLVYPFYEGIA